jgi:hypothetical protein
VYACHMIIKKNPPPLNMFNLMGDEGEKFVVGGILVHKARDWTVCGQQFRTYEAEGEDIFGTGIHADLSEINAKLAALDVRNNALLRNKIDNLVVPLACSIDYLGLRFECLSMLPCTVNSLAYGSDLNSVIFKDDDPEAEEVA